MRPGQHNKRSRGRSNRRHGGGGGGGGGNPLNRVYESNGPDVKVRGTAQTVADKYLQLGRDAQSSGDAVMAESYYQHAEHYLRLLAAAQAYNQQLQQQYRQPGQDEYDDAEGEELGEEAVEGGGPMGERPSMAQEPQEPPAGFEGERQQPQGYPNREFRPRQEGRDRFRPRWQDRQQQPYREDGDVQPRQMQPRGAEEGAPDDRAPRQSEPAQRAPDTTQWSESEQPSFLRRPAGNGQQRQRFERRPRREAASESEATETPPPADTPPVE
jgi:hypothetical protein